MKAVIYSRVSTDSQNTERQLKECTSYCKSNNFEIVDAIEETGSGYKNDRPGLDKVLEYVENHLVDVVVTYELSRLGRNNDVLKNIDTFDKNKVCLHTIIYGIKTDPRDGTSSFSNPFIGILSALSNSEAVIFKQRSASGLRRIAEQGKALGSNMYPYGYTKIEKKGYLVINDEEAEVVRNIFKMYMEGIGTLKISEELNKEAIKTRTGKAWRDAVVYGILNNSIYVGKRRYKGKTIDLPQLRIIEDELYNKVQERLRNNYNKASKHFRHDYYIDRGKITCGICGKTYYAHKRTDGKDNRYICISKRYGEDCGNIGISIDKLAKSVQIIILKHFKDILVKKLDNKEIKEKINEIEKLLPEFEKKLKRNQEGQSDAYFKNYSGKLNDAVLQGLIKRLSNEEGQIKYSIETYTKQLNELKETYTSITDIKKLENNINETYLDRSIINRIIKRIIIKPDPQPIKYFTKPYDKVVEIKLEVAKADNYVSFYISQREDFLYDAPTMSVIPLGFKNKEINISKLPSLSNDIDDPYDEEN